MDSAGRAGRGSVDGKAGRREEGGGWVEWAF